MVELLKQGQYKPLEVSKQVVLIFCATAKEGFLDHLPPSALGRYEIELFAWLESNKADLMSDLRGGVLKSDLKKESDPLRQRLVAALADFGVLFQA